MSQISVVLPPPVSANVYWRTRVVKGVALTYVSAEAEAFKRQVAAALMETGITQPIAGRVAVTMTLYPHRPLDWAKRAELNPLGWDDGVRSIDLDNAIKVTLDALKGLAFVDDALVRRIEAERAEPDGEARLVVRICPLAVITPQASLL
jgi:crossover junction endodeoxyribonuclease RusA